MSELRTVLGFILEDLNKPFIEDSELYEGSHRIHKVYHKLEASGILKNCTVVKDFPTFYDFDLLGIHTQEVVNSIKFVSEDFDDLLKAASCCQYLAKCIMEDEYANGFAVVRPPGHHAQRNRLDGFCSFNHAAIAAETALVNNAERVLIIDFDVHHGTGTQEIFYEDKRVLYISIHRYDNGYFWPNLQEASYHNVGSFPAVGYNINVPLNNDVVGDADYMAIFWNVVWPIASEYGPQFVVVSAGFDPCIGDPLGRMKLTPDCYSHMIYHLKGLAQGKLLMILEGGYNNTITADAVDRCVRVLCGAAPIPIDLSVKHKQSTAISCLRVIDFIRSLDVWRCFDAYNISDSTASYALSIEDSKKNHLDTSLECMVKKITNDEEWSNEKVPEFSSEPPYLIYVTNDDHFSLWEKNHPECPQRVQKIQQRLSAQDLEAQCTLLHFDEIMDIPKNVFDIHGGNIINLMNLIPNTSEDDLKKVEEELHSVYLHPSSMTAAMIAAGAVSKVMDKIIESHGPAKGFAAVRPPGHHACINEPGGFCLLNNVAIAADRAIKHHGLKRVLIVDWDVHHGDGTQNIFEDRSDVLYISLHRHDGGLFYPIGADKQHDFVGIGAGRGFNVNIPWSYDQMGDSEYFMAFYKIVMPIAYEFNPELVIISAGFDAAIGDPLGGYKLTPEAYSFMAYQLSALAGGNILAVLEGGYNLNSVAKSAAAVIETFITGKPVNALDLSKLRPVSRRALSSIRQVLSCQAEYWQCIQDFQLVGGVE